MLLHGEIVINRTILQIKDNINIEDYNLKSKEMMIEIAFWGQNQASFSNALMLLERYRNVKSNSDTILQVTEYIGSLVFDTDDKKAQKDYDNIANLVESKNKTKKNLYVEVDGAAINTRIEDENGSTWKENKLGIIFDDNDLYRRKDGSNTIEKKEYVSYFGSAEEFNKHLFSCMLKHDYQSYENVIFITDGATWIRNMINEFYPDAIQILDLFHLEENIHEYAKIIFKDNEIKIKNFYERTIERIYNHEFDLIFKELKKYQDIKLPSGVVNLATYLKNNE